MSLRLFLSGLGKLSSVDNTYKVCNYIQHDGTNDYIRMSNDSLIENDNSFTWSYYAYLPTIGTGLNMNIGGIWGGSYTARAWRLYANQKAGNVCDIRFQNSDNPSLPNDNLISTETISTNQTHLITVSYDVANQDLSIHVDGVKLTMGTPTISSFNMDPSRAHTLNWGGVVTSNNFAYNTYFGAYYNVKLSDADAVSYWNNGDVLDPTKLNNLLYRFDSNKLTWSTSLNKYIDNDYTEVSTVNVAQGALESCDVWLHFLFGQSNADGRGNVGDLVSPYNVTSNAYIYDGTSSYVGLTTSTNRSTQNKIGPLFGMNNGLKDSYPEVYFAKYAKGGHAIGSSRANTFVKPSTEYTNLINYFNDAYNQIVADFPTKTVKVVWYHIQGEAECVDGVADTYETLFNTLYTNIRSDIDYTEEFPVVISELPSSQIGYVTAQQNAFWKSEATSLASQSNIYLVNQDFASPLPDGVHFSTNQVNTVGENLVLEFLNEIKENY